MKTLQQTGILPPNDETETAFAFNPRKLPPPRQPNIAFASILLSYPVVIIAVLGLLLAGHPLFETLLIALGLQIVTFCIALLLGLLLVKPAELPQDGAGTPGAMTSETPATWRTYPCSDAAENAPRVALISPDTVENRKIATDLAERGREVHHSTDHDAMLQSVQARPGDWAMVIYDPGTAPDPATGAHDLRDFRAYCPDTPVLVLSDRGVREDLSLGCGLIGDATQPRAVFPRPSIGNVDAANPTYVAGH